MTAAQILMITDESWDDEEENMTWTRAPPVTCMRHLRRDHGHSNQASDTLMMEQCHCLSLLIFDESLTILVPFSYAETDL